MTSLRPEPASFDFPWPLLNPAISVGRPFFPVLCTRLAVRLIRIDERRHATVQLGNYIISGMFCITLTLLFFFFFFIRLSQSAEAWEDRAQTGEGKTRATSQSVTGPPVEIGQRKRQKWGGKQLVCDHLLPFFSFPVLSETPICSFSSPPECFYSYIPPCRYRYDCGTSMMGFITYRPGWNVSH